MLGPGSLEHRVNDLTIPYMDCPAKCLLVSLSSNEIAIVFPPLISTILCTLVHDIRWFVPTSISPLISTLSPSVVTIPWEPPLGLRFSSSCVWVRVPLLLYHVIFALNESMLPFRDAKSQSPVAIHLVLGVTIREFIVPFAASRFVAVVIGEEEVGCGDDDG